MSSAVPIASLLPGMQVYKYNLQQRIGFGSFGEVWLANDKAVDHDYAIKILKPGVPVHERLLEAQVGHRLTHNNLVRVHQADVVQVGGNDLVIIVMDYLPEGAVTKLSNPSGYIPLPEVIRIGTDILRGLEYLHGQNLFHNDVKPENVLIGPYSQGMLSDYGIVGISTDGAPVPPPDTYKIHTAPEVLNSNAISAQTDLFQTGMTLFRMLVGLGSLRDRFLRLGELQYYQAICSATLITDADFPPYVPARLRRIILKAICPDVKGRYVSALEMRRDLERLNFKGCWTVTPAGTFIGHDSTHEFRFEHNRGVGNRYSVTAFKKSKATQRETRVARFSAASLTGAQSERLIAQFVKFVVEGK